MSAWRILWRINPLILAVMVGCSASTHTGRVDTLQGDAVIHIPRTADIQPVKVGEEEFQRTIRRLARKLPLAGTPREMAEKTFQMDPLSGNYVYLRGDKKLVPLGPGEPLEGPLTKEDLETAERYRLWCQSAHGVYGDCLGGALVGGRYLDMQGRYVWALAMSKSPVLDEMKKALGDMVNFRAVFSAALWTGGSMLLILALNPVAPGLVAVMGVGLVLYVGYDTLHSLVAGWLQLMEEVKVAATFEQIREAGERFGKLLGRESARAFAMLLLAAIGRTVREFAAIVPTLPGAAQVALQAETQVRISLPTLGAVKELALTVEGVSITLPANAVVMAAQGEFGGKAGAQVAPPNSGGPGEWVRADESMSESARTYQAQITGAPKGSAYRVNRGDKEVDFDGFDQGVLLEVKATGYAQWITKKLDFLPNFKGRLKLLEQAKSQFKVANGTPIRWIVAEENLAGALRKMFTDAGLPIEVIHIPPTPPIP